MKESVREVSREVSEDQKHEAKPKMDVRLQATAIAWGTAFLMFFMTMPVGVASASPSTVIISLVMACAILLAATIATVAIWNLNRPGSKSPQDEADLKHIDELEERLANLETINNFERRLAEEALKHHGSNSSGKVVADEQSEIAASASPSEMRRVET